MAIVGIIMVREYVDACCAIAGIERPFGEIFMRSGKSSKDGFGVWIGFVNHIRGSFEELSVVLRIRGRIPIIDIGLVPDLVVLNAPTKMIDHPRYIFREGCDLLVCLGRPEHGI